MCDDILQEIPDEDLPKLSNIYKDHQKEAEHVFSLLNTCIAWKKKAPKSNYASFYGMNGDWLETGRFIVLMQHSCYDLFIYTLEGNGQVLYKALTQTKKIDWTKQMIVYAVNGKHVSTVFDVLDETTPNNYTPIIGWFWVIDKEKALQFEIKCPDDVYIGKLNQSYVPLMNSHWIYRYEGSEGYLSTFVEMNNCYGIFLKSNDNLVCWIMKNNMGQLAILQTLPEYTRRGYATILIKVLSKEIAEEGHHPLANIVAGNIASETSFKKLYIL